MVSNVDKMIYNNDMCGLHKYLCECNRVICNPTAGGQATYRAFWLKLDMLRKFDFSKLPFIVNTEDKLSGKLVEKEKNI